MADTTRTILLVAVAAFFMAAAAVVSAQAPSPGGGICAAGLAMCATALNGTKPSEQCCSALKTAMQTQLPCLCDVLKNPQFLAMNKLTPDKAFLIPQSCGLKADTSLCSAVSAQTPGAHAPSTGASKNDKGAAAKLAGSGLAGLILISITMMFY